MPDYLTTSEVAALLRTPVETVRYWRHVNRGPASFKAGRRVLYAEVDVREWIDRQREATKAGSTGMSGGPDRWQPKPHPAA